MAPMWLHFVLKMHFLQLSTALRSDVSQSGGTQRALSKPRDCSNSTVLVDSSEDRLEVQTREETEDNYSFIHSFECMVKSPEDWDKAVAWVPWDGYYSACYWATDVKTGNKSCVSEGFFSAGTYDICLVTETSVTPLFKQAVEEQTEECTKHLCKIAREGSWMKESKKAMGRRQTHYVFDGGNAGPPPRCPPVCHVWGGHGNQDKALKSAWPEKPWFGTGWGEMAAESCPASRKGIEAFDLETLQKKVAIGWRNNFNKKLCGCATADDCT